MMTDDDPDPDWRPYEDPRKETQSIPKIVEEWGVPQSIARDVGRGKRITPLVVWALPDMPTLRKGRVLFVGDSVHGTLPTQGRGLSMAIEDCAVLHELLINFPLSTGDNYKTVFRLYDEIRLPRVHFVAPRSRKVYGFLTAPNKL